MWTFGVRRWSNAKLNLREGAFTIKTSLRIISDFVNWIRVMQAFVMHVP